MTPPDPSYCVRVDQARDLVLARALEEADRSARLLSSRERERAGLQARAEVRSDDLAAVLAARARILVGLARSRVRGVGLLASATATGAGALWLAPLALVLGLATHVLGGKSVNVLAFPLLGALAWNLLVYLLLALLLLRGRRADAGAGAAISRRLAEALASARLRRLARRASGEDEAIVAEAGGRLASLWLATARPVLTARLRGALHIGAAALVTGLVAGMYVRGLAFEYRAQWESTFLSPEAARSLLSILLGPASALSGIALPDLESIEAPASGPAAAWIHLWALTAALVVLVPRLALATLEALRARRLSRALPIDLSDAYWRRLLAPAAGAGVRALVLPYGAPLAARASDRLRSMLHDLLGARAEVVQGPPLEYGAEADSVEAPDGRGCLVTVFSLAQSPELEVHGRLLTELCARVPAGGRLLAVVDGSSYAEQLGDGALARQRLEERRRAWDRTAREAELDLLHAELSGPVDQGLLDRAARVCWTAPQREGAR